MVLDASAILALLFGKPSAKLVLALARGGLLSSVNAIEVAENVARVRIGTDGIVEEPAHLELEIVPFHLAEARIAAELKALPRCKGLSRADRSCLAVAGRRALPVVTADRAWAALDLGIDVRLIR